MRSEEIGEIIMGENIQDNLLIKPVNNDTNIYIKCLVDNIINTVLQNIEPVAPIIENIAPIVEIVVLTNKEQKELIKRNEKIANDKQKVIDKEQKELIKRNEKIANDKQKVIDKETKELKTKNEKIANERQKVIDKENKILKQEQDLNDAKQNAILKIEEDKQKLHESDLINEDIMENGFEIIDSNKKVSLIKIKRDIIESTSTQHLFNIIKPNTFYKPYFQCEFKINNFESRITKQKIENANKIKIKEIIMNKLNILESFYDDNVIAKVVKTEIKTDLDDYIKYHYKIVINNIKIIPQKLKFLTASTFFNSDIYEDDYQYSFDFNDIFSNNIAFIKDTYNIVNFINDTYNDKYLSNSLLNKKVEKTEYYDKKALLYFYHNIDKYAKELYEDSNKKQNYTEYKDILKNKILNIIDLTDKTYFQKVIFLPNESNVNGRKISKTASYQNLPRKIRHSIGSKYYIDIDMKNAHFNLLLNLIQKHELPNETCNLLKDYATNRDFYLKDICKYYKKTTQSHAKEQIIMLTYGGDVDLNKCEWFEKFKDQVVYLQDYFSNHKEYKHFLILSQKEIINEAEKAKRNGEEYTANLIGKTLSKILQGEENKCLELGIEYLDSKNIEFASLQFDGLQLVKYECYKELGFKSKLKTNPINDNLLTDISKYIKEKVDINIDFHYKELDEGFILPNDYIYAHETEYILEDGYNENDISKIFIEANKHILNGTEDAIYIKENNVWITDVNCKEVIVNILKEMPIFYYIKKEKVRIDKLNSNLNNIASLILSSNDFKTADFEDKLNNSTIGNISFNNGVYNFKTKELLPYPQPDIVSTIKINRDYNPIRNEADITFLNDTFKSAFKDEDEDIWDANKALIARTIAGHFRDKFFVVKQGRRTTGKGVEIDSMKNAFGGYCGILKSSFFIEKSQVSEDENKGDAHLIFKRFQRYMSISEFQTIGKKKADGAKMKSFASGGDEQTARKLGGKDGGKGVSFTPHFMIYILANDTPIFNNNDAQNNCIFLQYHYQFIEEDLITDENKSYSKPIKLFENGMDLKELIKQPKYIDAYTHLIIDAYKPHPFILSPKLIELREMNKVLSSNKSADNILINYYNITNDINDKISIDTLQKVHNKYSKIDDELKYLSFKKEVLKYFKLTLPFKNSIRFKTRDENDNSIIEKVLSGFIGLKLKEGITEDDNVNNNTGYNFLKDDDE